MKVSAIVARSEQEVEELFNNKKTAMLIAFASVDPLLNPAIRDLIRAIGAIHEGNKLVANGHGDKDTASLIEEHFSHLDEDE